MNTLTRIAILTGCLTLSACLSPGASEKGEEFTKEDAKKIVNPDNDLCDVYNWYGDGQCDTFCENTDPDCAGIQCDGLPVCSDGAYEVEECAPDTECSSQTVCGTTILCEQWNACQNDDVPATACPDGYELVDSCPTDSDCYETSDSCGGRQLFCQAVSTCLDSPGCPLGTHEVTECFDGLQECFVQSICGAGTAVYCTPDVVNCDAEPVCPADYIEVESCPTDSDCYEETVCGSRVSCRRDDRCDDPPVCPVDYYLIQSCPTDSNCYEEVICGKTVSCMEGSINCLVPPECPQGTQQVPACDPSRSCNEFIECGIRLYCEDIGF